MSHQDNTFLHGIKVVDLSRLLPGPFCTQLLADVGAEVIKIDPPQGGDYARHYPPYLPDSHTGAFFDAINRGKKSVAIDLKNPRGVALCKQLIAQADVVVESFRPGVMQRLGLDYDTLKAINPELVMCSITGYGQHGDYAKRAGHDINYLALSGLLYETRTQHTDQQNTPIIPGFQVADIAGGALYAAFGIVGALFKKLRTGQGSYLDISMTHGTLSLHAGLHANVRQDPGAAKLNLLAGQIPSYCIYDTSDGRHMALGALEPKFWHAFVALLNVEHLRDEGMTFGTEGQKIRNEVNEIFKSKTQQQWIEFFAHHDVCCEPVLSPLESLEHALHTQQQRFITAQGMTYTTTPMGIQPTAQHRAPQLGEHTQEVLAPLMSHDDFEQLLTEHTLYTP